MLHPAGWALCETPYVHFVNHRVGQLPPQVPIPLPVERIVHHNAFGWANDAVRTRQIVSRQRFGVGVNQPGVSVKPLATLRIERPISLKVVQLAMPNARNKDAPDVAPAILFRIERYHLGWLSRIDTVVEQNPHRRG